MIVFKAFALMFCIAFACLKAQGILNCIINNALDLILRHKIKRLDEIKVFFDNVNILNLGKSLELSDKRLYLLAEAVKLALHFRKLLIDQLDFSPDFLVAAEHVFLCNLASSLKVGKPLLKGPKPSLNIADALP